MLKYYLDPDRKDTPEMDFNAGISLLSIKHELMLGYIHTLALLNAHRALGHSLAPSDDAAPALPGFGNAEREERGTEPADLIAAAVERRLVLEKTKVLEGRMRYQIEKLVRLSEEDAGGASALNGMLASLFHDTLRETYAYVRSPSIPPEPSRARRR